jgi:alpha-beta hydrolase superfamily lysophospholipase
VVETVRVTDGSGGTTLDCEAYLPGAPAPPTVLLSPAFGAGHGDYRSLARAWAAAGVACLVVHHPCCGRDAARDLRGDAARRAATGTAERGSRIRDVRAVLDAVEAGSAGPGLRAGPFGLAGHSMGARTALTFATGAAAEPRLAGYVVLSPSAPAGAAERDAYRHIRAPVLHVTGPRDVSPFGITPPAARRTAFDGTGAAEAYLLLLRGLGHHDALGREPPTPATTALAAATADFWSACLLELPAARNRLRSKAFPDRLTDVEAWEWH